MKNKVLALLSVLVGSSVFAAAPAKFKCTMPEEGQTVTLRFTVSGLDTENPTMVMSGQAEEEDRPVSWTPAELTSGRWPIASTLNDNWSIGKQNFGQANEALVLGGDGDGVILVELALYKNSGYTRGYFRYYGEERGYQTISCTRR